MGFLLQFLTPTVLKWTLLAGLVVGIYGWYVHTENTINTLEANVATLTESLKNEKEALAQETKDHESIVAATTQLQNKVDSLSKENSDLHDTLYREDKKKKSLEELALKKSKLIQDLINKGTDKAFKCFQTLSIGGECK